jgi:hypothetical protein
MACLVALGSSTIGHANAVPFSSVQYEATVVAMSSDGPLGLDSLSGTLGDDAVSLSADSIGAADLATAGAIVAGGLLSTSVDVSANAISNAVATARFIGSFVNRGPVSLSLDFTALNLSSGTGEASTTLFVSLASNGVTLFSDYVQGPWQFAYTPLVGTTSLLDLTLSSDASAAHLAAGPGNASGFGQVSIAGAVPEASTWLMLSLGLGVVGAAGSRARRKAVAVA